jgi:hypothetical protein
MNDGWENRFPTQQLIDAMIRMDITMTFVGQIFKCGKYCGTYSNPFPTMGPDGKQVEEIVFHNLKHMRL